MRLVSAVLRRVLAVQVKLLYRYGCFLWSTGPTPGMVEEVVGCVHRPAVKFQQQWKEETSEYPSCAIIREL